MSMETAELLKKVRHIEIKTRGLSNHIFSGEYHSAFKGRGMSFSEVREYQFGDDVRSIDWNVTARTQKPHVKIFEEERELTVILLIDVSRSSFFGTRTQSKNELIAELAAILSFSAIQNNDKVGVIFFTDKIEKFIPPKKGKSHILRIIREVVAFEPQSKGTDLSIALSYLCNVIKRRAITFLISDFMAIGYEKEMNIAAKKHDLVGIRIVDPAEEKLPDSGMLYMEDSETAATQWIDTSDLKIRAYYEKKYLKNKKYNDELFQKTGTDCITIKTNKPYIDTMISFFKKRSLR